LFVALGSISSPIAFARCTKLRNVALDMDRVTAAYERLDTLLENRRYPVGDRFGRADLTVAALAAVATLRTPLPQQFDPRRLPQAC
jgi:glutathione S-transferase